MFRTIFVTVLAVDITWNISRNAPTIFSFFVGYRCTSKLLYLHLMKRLLGRITPWYFSSSTFIWRLKTSQIGLVWKKIFINTVPNMIMLCNLGANKFNVLLCVQIRGLSSWYLIDFAIKFKFLIIHLLRFKFILIL